MKPRRRLTSVDLLPTIVELQENELLEDYMESIRELSQPSYPLSGPLQGSRLGSLRTARLSLAHRPWALIQDMKGPAASQQDPLDWLFTQAQHAQASPEDVGMI